MLFPNRRIRRQYALETLESRTLLSYTFGYNSVTQVATASGTVAVDSLIIEPVSGFLEYSVNGSPFSGNWGGLSVPAAPTVTVDINLSSGNGSTLQLGTPTGPASQLLATFSITTSDNTTDTATIDDSNGTLLASAIHPYWINTANNPFSISGPGFAFDEPSGIFSGGITLKGSAVSGNIYNVLSTYTGEPMTIHTASGTTSTVNVGDSGTLSNIDSPVAIYNSGDSTTVNINDSSDTTSGTATLDKLSGNTNVPYEVTGLSPAAIEYGANVMALNINGGTSGATTGVTYEVNNTQADTTTTINGGPKANSYVLAYLSQSLDNLPGPLVIDGGGAGDGIVANDSNQTANYNYTVTSSTVTDTGLFGGLTYSNLGAGNPAGSVTLYASSGNNVINVNSTSHNIATIVYGEAGVDTINVNGTGTGSSLSVTTGNSTDDASTVNVIANSETVTIASNATFPTVTTVNIGSTGGHGAMAGIQGRIPVVNGPSLTALNFHDENDTTGQTWTLTNNDTTYTGTVAVTGSATTTYNPVDLSELTINGGGGGNTFVVDNTSEFYPTTLNAGTGSNTVSVYASGNNTLNINGQGGDDAVTLGGGTVGADWECRASVAPSTSGTPSDRQV